MQISKLTIIYATALVISASFLRQILSAFYKALGRENIVILLWLTFALLGTFFIFQLWKSSQKEEKNIPFGKWALILTIFFIGIYYASTFNVPEERIHLVKYGILGWLISNDNFHKKKKWTLAITVLFCLTVAGVDEIFQYFLPMRVGDIRDVGFGGIGGFWGGSFYLAIFVKKTIIKLN